MLERWEKERRTTEKKNSEYEEKERKKFIKLRNYHHQHRIGVRRWN
jgi:hypothetical protein